MCAVHILESPSPTTHIPLGCGAPKTQSQGDVGAKVLLTTSHGLTAHQGLHAERLRNSPEAEAEPPKCLHLIASYSNAYLISYSGLAARTRMG